jgi:hypothetical protein
VSDDLDTVESAWHKRQFGALETEHVTALYLSGVFHVMASLDGSREEGVIVNITISSKHSLNSDK